MNKKTAMAAAALALAAAAGVDLVWADNTRPHVYINPGHGGHDSDDRNVVVPGFVQGDTAGFWESNSNLKKGLAMKQILELKGYTTSISRVTNTTDDDLPLSTIVRLSNNSGADIFYSIHSNATGAGENYRVNFPMGIYRGYTGSPVVAGSDSLLRTLIAPFEANQATVWTAGYAEYGDWTFYPHWGKQGLGVLRGNTVVSMLNEGSYHDYIPEAQRLLTQGYCWLEAWNFTLSADTYFGRSGHFSQGFIAGIVRDDRLLRNASYVKHGADEREPVNNAKVRLIAQGGAVVDSCLTDTLQNGVYAFKYVEPGDYTIEVTEEHHFAQTKAVTVSPNAVTYQNFDLKRVRETAPQVTAYSPVWHEGDPCTYANVPIVLDFNWDMDVASTQAAFTISPAVEGSFKWEDSNYRMTFRPDDAFEVNTLYTVTLGASAEHGGGMAMGSDFTFQFMTDSRNHIYPLSYFPMQGDQVHYKSGLNVEFRTDSLLDPYDLSTHFHVYDAQGAELQVTKRSVKNNKRGDDYGYCRLPLTKDLVPGAEYRLVVDKNLADTVGLMLTDSVVATFKAVDYSEEKAGEVLAGFESVEGLTAATSGHEGVTAKIAAVSDRLFGSKAVSLTAAFTADDPQQWAEVQVAGAPALSGTDAIGLHVHGDMNYCELQARLAGSNGSERLVSLGTVAWNGWRYLEVPLAELPADSYTLQAIRLVKGETVQGRSAVVKLDNLLKTASSGASEVGAQGSLVTVSCAPGSGYLVASAPALITGIELYDTAGRLVAAGGANWLNVSALPRGTYVARVATGAAVTAHKVHIEP